MVHLLTITNFCGTPTDEMPLAMDQDGVKRIPDLHSYKLTNLPFTTCDDIIDWVGFNCNISYEQPINWNY